MNRLTLLTAAGAVAVGGMTFVGCEDRSTTSNAGTSETSGTGQTAGEKTDNAIDRAGDAVGRAVDKTKEGAQVAGERIAEGAERAGDKLAAGASRVGDELKEGTRDARQGAERAGERVAAGADRAGDRVAAGAGRAGERTGELTDNARQASGEVRVGAKGTAAAPDAEGIRDILASVTEAALTENGLNDLTERLVDADRNHIGSAIGEAAPEHAALVRQFRADWKAKYNQEFDIQAEEKVFPDTMFTVTQSEVGAAAPSGAEVASGQRPGDLNANREAGRNTAVVAVKASHGMPELSVPLLHEMPDNWRIDAPATLTAAKLRSNIVAHLKAAHAMKDQWPASVDQAYAAVGHHVLMAILDKPVQK